MIVIEERLDEATIINMLKGEIFGNYSVLKGSVEDAIGYTIRGNIHYYTAKQEYNEKSWIDLTNREKENIVNFITKKLDKIGGRFVSNLSFTPKTVDKAFQDFDLYSKKRNKPLFNVSRIAESHFADIIIAKLLNDNVARSLKNHKKYRFDKNGYVWDSFNKEQKEFICDYANTYMNELFPLLSNVSYNKVTVSDVDNAGESLQLKLA